MSNSPNLDLPYLEAAQAQKHVTHNEALTRLDALVQISVLDVSYASPPASPAPSEGDRYIVAAVGAGDWLGWDNHIAAYQDGAWIEYTPLEGWIAWDQANEQVLVFNGSAWVSTWLQYASVFGVNATAEDTNKLTVASEYSLFNNIGSNVYLKLNKAAVGNTASTLYQDNWSGRAEVGLVGNDDFSFKVSPDGSNWYTGITLVSGAKGVPRLPTFTVANLPAAGTAGAGAIAMVTDANATTYASVVAGSGANTVPVYSDGTNWRIG